MADERLYTDRRGEAQSAREQLGYAPDEDKVTTIPGGGEEVGELFYPEQRTLWGDVARRYVRNRAAMAATVFLVLLLIFATFGPLIRPWDFDEGYITNPELQRLQLPNSEHWFGTDDFARDLFVRMAMATRVSLLVAVAASALILAVGILYGGFAGFIGGSVDNTMMRFVDVLYGLPYLPFAIIMVVLLGAGIVPLVLGLSIVSWLTPSRLVRGQILTLKQNEYVEAARAVGSNRSRIMFRHLLPNTLGIIVIAMFLEIPGTIIAEATLSFIGLGISAPQASWGTMIQSGYQYLRTFPWMLFLPAIFLATTVLAFNFIGDGFRDAIDPRTKESH